MQQFHNALDQSKEEVAKNALVLCLRLSKDSESPNARLVIQRDLSTWRRHLLNAAAMRSSIYLVLLHELLYASSNVALLYRERFDPYSSTLTISEISYIYGLICGIEILEPKCFGAMDSSQLQKALSMSPLFCNSRPGYDKHSTMTLKDVEVRSSNLAAALPIKLPEWASSSELTSLLRTFAFGQLSLFDSFRLVISFSNDGLVLIRVVSRCKTIIPPSAIRNSMFTSFWHGLPYVLGIALGRDCAYGSRKMERSCF